MAACDIRGNPRGEAVAAQARIGDAADTTRVRVALGRKYGLLGLLAIWSSRVRRGSSGTVAVLISPA